MNELQPVTPISVDNIKSKIHEIRGQKVMLDRDLAELCRKYIWFDNGENIEKCGVPTARINDGDVTFLPTFSPYGTVWHRKTGIFHMCRRYANNNVVRYISTDHSPYKTIRHRKTGIFHMCRRYANNNVVRYISTDHSPPQDNKAQKNGDFSYVP